MRIGIHPALKRHDGGIYQYTVTMLRALHELTARNSTSEPDEFVVFAHDTADEALAALTHPAWSIRPFRPLWSPSESRALEHSPDPDAPGDQPDMRAWLTECGVDFMVYPAPHRLSFESGVPFVMAVHDLQHRLQPEFPEVSADGEWERREYLFRNAARSAALLIAESQVGREDILSFYGDHVTPERVMVLPYLPAHSAHDGGTSAPQGRIRHRYQLPDRYLFYPAQLWPHKNHLRLVEALGLLRSEHGLSIPLVLTGAATGALREHVRAECETRASHLGVAEQVRMLGYVDDEDIADLYRGAVALVMPTFFGPTNIPFLEAWAHDCPVLTSRIRGITEQVGDAAITVDPRSVPELADGIRRLWTQDALRSGLIERGRKRLRLFTYADYLRCLEGILRAAKERVRQEKRTLAGIL